MVSHEKFIDILQCSLYNQENISHELPRYHFYLIFFSVDF